jgi:PAT family beta-lactamase induction signal transducer AmpG
MTRPHWLAILVFVVLYKLGDALAGVMTNPFLINIGFSKEEIATVVKLGGMIATILGTFCGGAVAVRLGVLKGLWISGALHLLTNFFLIVQAHIGHNVPMLWLTISSENFTGGISSAIFVAFISGLCNVRFTATQYALLSSLAVVGRTLLSSTSGFMAERMSWEWFFFTTIIAALPGLAMLIWMQKKKIIA